MIDDFLLLKRRPYRDRDAIVEGVGRVTGRFSAVVKGRSGAGGFEAPALLRVKLMPGQSGMGVLSGPVLQHSYSSLRRSLDALMVAGFLGRLFLAVLPERMTEEAVYELLEQAFASLDRGRSPVLLALWAQDRLLCVLGLGPHLNSCLGCDSLRIVGFSGVSGGLLCDSCYSGSGFAMSSEALSVCRSLRFQALEEFCSLSLSPEAVRSLGRLYKEQFIHHLGLSPSLFRRVLPVRAVRVHE